MLWVGDPVGLKWSTSREHVLSNRNFDNHPYNNEKFTKRKKGRSRHQKSQASFREMVRRARQRIIDVTKTRGNGVIEAHDKQGAVGILNRWLDRRDASIGKGSQRFAVVRRAFEQLLGARVFREEYEGYVLNLAT